MENEISAPLHLQSKKKKIMQDSEFSPRRMLWFNPAPTVICSPPLPQPPAVSGMGERIRRENKVEKEEEKDNSNDYCIYTQQVKHKRLLTTH